MTEQEEIREGIDSKIGDKLHDHAYYRQWDDKATVDLISKSEVITKVVLDYLHSQGVVIRVNRGLLPLIGDKPIESLPKWTDEEIARERARKAEYSKNDPYG